MRLHSIFLFLAGSALMMLVQCQRTEVKGSTELSQPIEWWASTFTVKEFNGYKVRIYEKDSIQVSEPVISFRNTCDPLVYSNLYQQYQLTLPISIETSTLTSPTYFTKKAARFTLTDLLVKPNKALSSENAKLTLMSELTGATEAQLIIQCDTFDRCQQLQDDISVNPDVLQRAVEFIPIGFIGSSTVAYRLNAVRSVKPPQIRCPRNQWVVFQKRVDGSLSFAKNWDAYVRGFGNPKTNYWMGLQKLSATTVTSKINAYPPTSRCRLRIETEDFKGRKYSAEYGMFQVLGPEQKYRLRVGSEKPGSNIQTSFTNQNEMEFSTFDNDNDKHSSSCSQEFGYGGWWYAACHQSNLNGAYNTTVSSEVDHPVYNSLNIGGKYVIMRSSLMQFKCD